MATPINQVPSQWAVYITLKNGEKLFWDYVFDEYFAWRKGVFLCWQNGTVWNRIAGVDEYPVAQAPDYADKLVNDCVTKFNEELNARWPPISTAHPVDKTIYQKLKGVLLFDPLTQRFKRG